MPQSLPARGAALLMALVAALLLFRLGDVPLTGPDEPRYARVAVEMGRSGDLVTPTLQGEPWLEKPALYYWLAAGAFGVFGENEAAARLPSVLACLLTVGSAATFGARVYGSAAGLHTGFILGTGLLAFAYGRAASMDMLVAAGVTMAIGLAGLRALRIAGSLAIPAAYLAAALATLAKGPLGFLLPALVLAAYLLLTRDRKLLRELASPLGLLLFLLVAGPWYALVYRAQGQAFLDVFILDHNVRRFTSEVHRHPGPPYYYLPVLLAGVFPWSGLVLPGLAALRARTSRADLFVLLWLVAPLVFFSAAGSKLPGYVLPCLPPLALAMGRAADRLLRRADFPAGTGPRAAAALGLVVSALAATSPFVLWRMGDPGWPQALPVAAWSLFTGFAFSRRVGADPGGALRVLRVSAGGLLLLLASAAPSIIDRRESGRRLFVPARGREVLAWGAWRTAWMAGYFYNDGRVRPVERLEDVLERARNGAALVVCGAEERRRLEALSSWRVRTLAEGPRGNVLMRVAAP